MRWLNNLTIFALLLASCGSDQRQDLPEDVLDSETMAQLIADVQLSESATKVAGDGFQINFDSVDIYRAVFDNYQVTPEDFNNSMQYYSLIPDSLEAIYERAIVLLSEKQAEIETGE